MADQSPPEEPQVEYVGPVIDMAVWVRRVLGLLIVGIALAVGAKLANDAGYRCRLGFPFHQRDAPWNRISDPGRGEGLKQNGPGANPTYNRPYGPSWIRAVASYS